MKKIISFILVLFCSLQISACGNDNVENEIKRNTYKQEQAECSAYYLDGTDFVPVVRFLVFADLHVHDDYLSTVNQRFVNMMQDVYAYSESQQYNKLDAVISVGDYVDKGTQKEYESYNQLWSDNMKSNTTFITVQAGHELIECNDNSHIVYSGSDYGTHIKIGGYHFIAVSNQRTDENGDYSEYTNDECNMNWVREQLDIAVRDTGNYKPIFTFQHHPMSNTIIGSQSEDPIWGLTPEFQALYSEYSNIVDFNGHNHLPINHVRAINQKDFTVVHAGSVYYCTDSSDLEDRNYQLYHPDTQAAVAGCNIVEVDANGRVRILPYNIVGRSFYTETGTGKHDVQLIRYIECAGDKNTWLYTESNNDKKEIPYFENTAKINQIEIFDDNTTKTNGDVIFPAGERQYLRFNMDSACDNDGIEAYKMYVYKKSDNKMIRFKQLFGSQWKETDFMYLNSKYYATPIPKSFSVIASGLEHLEAGEQYEIQIYAIDMYHNISKNKLTCLFTFDGTKCIISNCEVK